MSIKLSRLMSSPRFVNWNINYTCNFSCDHCYSRIPKKITECSHEQYLFLTEEFIKSNVFTVALGGGEPMMVDKVEIFIEKMSRAGINTYMTTNAWFLEEKNANKLREANLGTIYISLDSATQTIHDTFRNRNESYNRVITGIKNSKAAGLNVKLSTVVSLVNYRQLKDILDIAALFEIAGVEFKRFRPSGNGLVNKSKYMLSDEQNEWVRKEVESFKAQYSKMDVQLVYGVEANEVGCPCGIKSLAVRPNGDVSPCVYNDVVIGNLFKTSLMDLWVNSPELVKMREGKGCKALSDTIRPLMPKSEEIPLHNL